jgi:hypothetical protein
MTTRIETENSTYEIDSHNKRARRIEGDIDDNSSWPEDLHVWREFTGWADLYGRLYVVWPDGKATLTSQIKGAEEVA